MRSIETGLGPELVRAYVLLDSLFIHCLFTVYSLFIHCLFTVYSLLNTTDSLLTD